MHLNTLISSVLLTAVAVTASSVLVGRSEVNGPCIGANGVTGVCVPTAQCRSKGGDFIDRACPGTGIDVKCCTKPSCGADAAGYCGFTGQCASQIFERYQCPGGSTFSCCMPAGSGGPTGPTTPTTPTDPNRGPYADPRIPTTAEGCQAVASDGATTIVAHFPGMFPAVGCARPCPSDDHCGGMATDLMVAAYNVKTDAGEPIAEWIMNNAVSLSVKYIMWGQRIWYQGQDQPKPWSTWKYANCLPNKLNCINGDRGTNTLNHWDHVHVSYRPRP